MVKYDAESWRKAVIVGLTVLVLDWLIHTFYANPETNLYYLSKPIISGYVALLMYSYKGNFLNLKRHTIGYYLQYSVLFAAIHGLYYRAYELIYGAELYSRIGDISFPALGLEFSGGIISLAIGWLLIHGGSFFIGVMIAKRVVK